MTRTDNTPVPDYPGMLRLDGRQFVLIGAGQGIGRQSAHALASAGARVFCVDREPDLAVEIAAEIDGISWSGDATRREDAERLYGDAARQMGRIDGLVDIVGMSQYRTLLNLDDELWDWHFDVNLRHAYLAIQLAGREMIKAGGGVMVFVASVSAYSGAPLHAAYGAAKAGLMSLVKSATLELGPQGVRVNAVAPGVVFTPRVGGYLGEEGRQRNAENAPLRRVALPADIAATILYLASDLSSYVSGQTIAVDGGVVAKFPFPMPDVATDAG